jgi:Fuc2NAc and GlcNAc transferase
MIRDMTDFFIRLIQWVDFHRVAMLFAVCIGLGAFGAWFVAGIPFREHLLDSPNERSSHTTPTPVGGGVGILAAFFAGGLTLRIPTTFLFGALLISAVSFYGDYFRISVKFRLLVHLVSALIVLFPFLPRLSSHFAVSYLGFSPLVFFLILPLIALFMMGTANFYNFMDGINGMAGLSGVIAFGMLGLHAGNDPTAGALHMSLALLSICIAMGCLGYLPFNMPRARVFMGDGGSVFLGFVFSAFVVVLGRNYLEMVCYAALLFPFYADTLTTIIVRLRDREKLTTAHRRHLYQILANDYGMGHGKVTMLYGVVQFTIGMIVLRVIPLGIGPVLFFLTLCTAGFTLVSMRMRKRIKRL